MTLVQLAEACDIEGVRRELGALTPDERAAQAEALEARRATMRSDWYHVPEQEKAAQLAAELGCRIDPWPRRTGSFGPRTAATWVVFPLAAPGCSTW